MPDPLNQGGARSARPAGRGPGSAPVRLPVARLDLSRRAHVQPVAVEQIYLIRGMSAAGPEPGTIRFQPRPDVEPRVVAFPLDWAADPFGDRNWCAQLHMWRLVDFAFLDFAGTRDPACLDPFLRVARDWHAFHVAGRTPAGPAWRDMMVGLRAMKLACFISQVQQGLVSMEATDIDWLHDLVELHLGCLLDAGRISFSNHTLTDLHGAAALARVVQPDTRRQIDDYLDQVFPEVMARQFDANGVHMENSPGYHRFGINYLRILARSGWFARHGLDRICARAEAALPWFHLPDGRLAAVGDTDGGRPRPRSAPPVGQTGLQVFESSGYAVVRDDGGGEPTRASYLLFMGAYQSRVHKHADDLSVLWHFGEDILCDSGKYAYKDDDFRRYVRARHAHNTVEIGEPVEPQLTGPPYGSALGQVTRHHWGVLIRAAVRFEALGVTHRRFCLVSSGGWLLLVDRLEGAATHTFTQCSHLAPAIQGGTALPGGFGFALPSGRALAVRFATSHEARAALYRGDTEPRLQGWTSEAYGRIGPSVAIEIRQQGASATFATLYAVEASTARLALDGAHQLALDVGADAAVEHMGIRLDGPDCQVSHSHWPARVRSSSEARDGHAAH